MKKLFLISLCLVAAFSANAQFVQNGSYSDAGGGVQYAGKTGCNKIAAIVSVASLNSSLGSEKCSDIGPMVGIVYTRNQRMDDTSLYLEFGGGFLFTWFDQVMYNDYDLKLYSLYFPVNIDYHFDFGTNSYVSLFTGPYLKYNLAVTALGRNRLDDTKKVQVGWQGGVDVSFGGLYLSLSYNGDVSNLLDFSGTDYSNVKNKVSGFVFGLGVVF